MRRGPTSLLIRKEESLNTYINVIKYSNRGVLPNEAFSR